MNDWVTVASNTGPVEIAVLKDCFEEEDIEYFLREQNSPYQFATMGLKIQVRESDKERALEILKETGYIE
jgi:hypothetical protein